jgi:hypothetical protein
LPANADNIDDLLAKALQAQAAIYTLRSDVFVEDSFFLAGKTRTMQGSCEISKNSSDKLLGYDFRANNNSSLHLFIQAGRSISWIMLPGLTSCGIPE